MTTTTFPSWADIYDSTQTPSPEASGSRLRAPGWHNDDADVTDFGPSRLDDEVEIVVCPDCGKVVLLEAFTFHQQNCQLIRDISEGRMSPSIIEGDTTSLRKRRFSDVSDASTPSRISGPPAKMSKKAQKQFEAQARKKAKMEAQEAKRLKKHTLAARRKGITDVDTQCGVINDKGLPCSRSLTCKSHSMGAKRAVEGRSKPYDELLLEWQRIHNPALVAKLEEKERALAASKAAAAERKHRKMLEKKKQKLARQGIATGPDGQPLSTAEAAAAGAGAANAASKVQEDPNSDMYTLGFKDDEVDSELSDLVHAIRSAVQNDRTRILPMAQRSFTGVYTRRTHTLRSCRELLREGLRSAAHATNRAASFAAAAAAAAGSSSAMNMPGGAIPMTGAPGPFHPGALPHPAMMQFDPASVHAPPMLAQAQSAGHS